MSKEEIYHVTVDYSRSLAKMIRAGHYDWVNPDFTDITAKNFSIQGQGKLEINIELIHYCKSMEADEIIQDLDNRGLRPATLPELLAFGAKYPKKQREFPIVALGSIWLWGGSRVVAYLSSFCSKRRLGLPSWDGGWNDECRFAALRK